MKRVASSRQLTAQKRIADQQAPDCLYNSRAPALSTEQPYEASIAMMAEQPSFLMAARALTLPRRTRRHLRRSRTFEDLGNCLLQPQRFELKVDDVASTCQERTIEHSRPVSPASHMHDLGESMEEVLQADNTTNECSVETLDLVTPGYNIGSEQQMPITISRAAYSCLPGSLEDEPLQWADPKESHPVASGSDQQLPQTDTPRAKRKREIAISLASNALNAAMYTGATAWSAYSLYSSWRYGATSESGESSDATQSFDSRPPGAFDEPPPPYETRRRQKYPQNNLSPLPVIDSTTAQPRSSPAHDRRPIHVFLTSRRRRAALPRRRMAQKVIQSLAEAATESDRQSSNPNIVDEGIASTSSSAAPPSDTATTSLQPSVSSATELPNTPDSNMDEDADDADEEDTEDEVYTRLRARMSALIEEGKAALVYEPSEDEISFDIERRREQSYTVCSEL